MKKIVPFKFIHCADLHLATPFEGMFEKVPPALAELLYEATFKAFSNVVAAAILHNVEFVVIAGDIYDGIRHSIRAQIKFAEELEKLARHGIKCFIAHGNHDPLEAWQAQYDMPGNVHCFGAKDVECVRVSKDGQVIANIYGISHGSYNVEDNLALRFKIGESDVFSVGVLHCNVGRLNEDRYAPCALHDLEVAGIDYWALGHVHTKQQLKEQNPCVIYPGNTQGLNIREQGERGCFLVEVDQIGNIKTTFISTDVIRWQKAECNISKMEHLTDLVAELRSIIESTRKKAQGRGSILRIELVGRGALDKVVRGHSKDVAGNVEEDLLEHLRENEEARSDFVWLESIIISTKSEIDIEARRKAPDFIGDFLRRSMEIRNSLTRLEQSKENKAVHEIVRNYVSKRPEFNKISFILDSMDERELLAVLDDAENIGLNLLIEGEEA